LANFKYVSPYLKPLKRQKLLNDISVFDIETNTWLDNTYNINEDIVQGYHDKPIKPFLLVYYDGKHAIPYQGKDCMYNFLKKYLVYGNRNRICFSHNGGKFDILALYECFREHLDEFQDYSYQPIMQGSRIMSFKIYDHNRHRWEFRDSFSLLPRSLSYLCQSFKPDHIKLERPSTVFENDPDTWIRYCKNDCISLYEILQKFNSIIEDIQGSIGYTIASTSLGTFRKKFLKNDLQTYFRYNDFFRRGYYGGRVEIFNMYARENGKPYYLYDVNSMYPYVMYSNEFPISRPRRMNYKHVEECFGRCGIMECEITTPDDLYIPILPYHREDKKLVFPLGHWKGVYEYSFIEEAYKYGYDIKILRSWEFDSEYLFKDFVDYFYTLKNNSSGAEKEIYKLVLNSLYGKWGELPKRKQIITDPDASFIGKYPYDTFFGYAIKEYEQYSAYHLPCISIRVTALAQVHLYRVMQKIMRMGGEIYYCDTDSIVTDIRLDTSQELGGLGLECTFKEGIFLLPKTYILHLYDMDKEGKDLKIKIKGFSQSLKDHVGDIQVWRKALIEQDYSMFIEKKVRPASLNEIRIRHLSGFVTLLENRRIINQYDKRSINDDYSTNPPVIGKY